MIIHRSTVNLEALLGSANARRALEEILRIERDQSQEIIHILGYTSILDPKMPPPSNELEVRVSGAYTENCVTFHLFALRKAGHNARFHLAGCLSSGEESSDYLRKFILKKYPNFFD